MHISCFRLFMISKNGTCLLGQKKKSFGSHPYLGGSTDARAEIFFFLRLHTIYHISVNFDTTKIYNLSKCLYISQQYHYII